MYTIFQFKLHKDCCNSVSIHPYRPILATGSGQYHFKDLGNSLEDPNETSETISKSSGIPNIGQDYENMSDDQSRTKVAPNNGTEETNIDTKYSSVSENSLVFWWIGDVDLEDT